jgi:hypothetical protein
MNGTSGTVQLKEMSEVANFIVQILASMAYGGSAFVKSLNKTSFLMWRMVRTEVEILVSVVWFSVDFGGQCRLLPDDQNIQLEWRLLGCYAMWLL